MAKVNVYNLAGEVVGQQELSQAVFGAAVNPVLVQQVVVAQQSSARRPWAHTKVRSEVRGGGKKPWRQKGTGNARHGSIRSPLWKGGGVTFGPLSERNYTKKVNKKMKQNALRMVLADKLASEQVILVDSLELPEIKTKQVADALKKLPLKGRKTLFVTENHQNNFIFSSRNVPGVETIGANSLNVVELMKHQNLVIPVSALQMIESLYGMKK